MDLRFPRLYCLSLICGLVGLPAQDRLFHQVKNSDAVVPASASVLAELGDPLFNLVLENHPGERDLTAIEDLIQPNAAQRHVFVVDETIANPARVQGRRAVITFTGSNGGEVLSNNVMLSALFNSEAFPERSSPEPLRNLAFIEGWGWDNHRGRYNYYRLDRAGSDSVLTWKFRGSSDGADLMSAQTRAGTCMACHVNGAPIMKELLRPWNHWRSLDSSVPYLSPITPAAERWPVADSDRLRGVPVGNSFRGGLAGAERLEAMIIPAIHQFDRRRINRFLKRNDSDGDIEEVGGFQTMMEGRRLLRHMFLTTEFNIISQRRKSNLHPIPQIDTRGPADDVMIPASFFLNANLIQGGGPTRLSGLEIQSVGSFAEDVGAVLIPEEYKTLIRDSGTRIDGVLGDADFCWLVPEASQIDNDMADQAMTRGIVPAPFLAAVLAIDLERPLLSQDRATLLAFVPDRFRFKPLQNHSDRFDLQRYRDHELTQETIAALEAASPVAGSAPARFLARLKNADPIGALRQDIEEYKERLRQKLENPQTRAEELRRLHELAVQIRQEVLDDPVLGRLDETGGRLLFPHR